jgi:hypothetical protein
MLSYNSSSVDVVRSIRQRWLFGLWNRARSENLIPHWSSLQVSDLASCFDYLNFIKVFQLYETVRYQVLGHGQQIGLMFGSGDCTGKFLDEVIPELGLSANLEPYSQVVDHKLPVYTRSNTHDAGGTPVEYERLLLPFSETPGRVTHIIGMLEPTSTEGLFDRKNLFASNIPDQFTIKAILAPQPYSRHLRGSIAGSSRDDARS